MPPTTAQATQDLAPTFAQAGNALSAQIPAISTLYAALVSGLQGQSNNQVQNVVNSAQARGVYRPSTVTNTQAALGQTLAQQTGQLGAQQAQDTAAANLGIGQLNVQKAKDIQALSGTLQNISNTQQQAQNEAVNMQRQGQLDMQKAQQNYNINQAQYNTAQAKAVARAQASAAKAADLSSMSESAITRQLRLGLNGVKGGDNHVSPENLAKAYIVWQQAGLDPVSFWKNFQGDWNPKQGNYNDQFHYFIQKYSG